ncbi:MAG: ATP-dependent helicase [Psychrobacillus sp.]
MRIYEKTFPYPIGSKRKEILLAPVRVPLTTKEIISSTEKDAPFFRELESQGINLNEAQVKAVRHIKGPLVMIAGAGSGKTRVLTARTSYILEHDKDVIASQIMLITFTKKAASEMVERLQQMLPKERIEGIVYGTFHSVFLRLLRKNGYTQKVLGSDAFRRYIIKKILKERKLHELYAPETVLAKISTWKNYLLSWSEIEPKSRAEKDFINCYEAYEEWKYEHNYMDFDDILFNAYILFKTRPDVADSVRNHLKYICVDEYQDSNMVQNELIKAITHEFSNVFFVADPDQLIYSFNHSSDRYLHELNTFYPSLELITLSTNYRSTQSIIGAANKVISYNTNRFEKECESIIPMESGVHYFRPTNTEEEAKWITDHIVALSRNEERSLNEFAVLYRTHSISRAIIDELALNHIPFVIYGGNTLFYEHPYIKPLVSYLQLIVSNTNIQALAEIAPTLYMDKEKAFNVGVDYHVENPTKLLMNALLTLELKPFQFKQVKDRIQLMKQIESFEPVFAIKRLRRAFYDKFFEASQEETMHQTFLNEMLNELEASAKRFKTISAFIQFIGQVTETYNHMGEEEYPEAVRLMTIHQSKGLEFPVVFTIGASEKMIPHSSSLKNDNPSDRLGVLTKEEAIAEERRLLYVAMSRAKEELFVSSPKTYHNRKTEVSRFLLEAYS